MTAHSFLLSRCVMAVAALALGACAGETGTSSLTADQVRPSMRFSLGEEVDITLGTVGGGQYDSIPTISSLAVRFLDAAVVGPYVPAGPRQRFRFRAQAVGVAIITFRHSDRNPTVIDTVAVR